MSGNMLHQKVGSTIDLCVDTPSHISPYWLP